MTKPQLLLTSLLAVSLLVSADGPGGVRAVFADEIDFDHLPAGTIVEQITSKGGVGPIHVRGVNLKLGYSENAAIIFDSSCPGGCTGGDKDLGSPHFDFGGPGRGSGGRKGQPNENGTALGKLLIIGEQLIDSNSDDLVDDPDDQAATPVMLEFDFSDIGPVTINGLTIIDVEFNGEFSSVRFYDSSGVQIGKARPLPMCGNNGVANTSFSPVPDVELMVVTIEQSGGIATVFFDTDDAPLDCESDLDCDDGEFCNGEEECDDGQCEPGDEPCDGPCDEENKRCNECESDLDCDDGKFCNGEEDCDDGQCEPGDEPCDGPCDEDDERCNECESDSDCDDGIFCNGDEDCDDGQCEPGDEPCDGPCDEDNERCNECESDSDCDDGIFCNGEEDCDDGQCEDDDDRCDDDEVCNEDKERCDECERDSDCDDGKFCNGEEECDDGQCEDGSDRCDDDEVCNEDEDRCDECKRDSDCDDGKFCNGEEECDDGECEKGDDPCPGEPEAMGCDNDCNEADGCVDEPFGASCGDGEICTANFCDGEGMCLAVPVENEEDDPVPCNDGKFCNGDDTCGGGRCSIHTGNPCPTDRPRCIETGDKCVACDGPPRIVVEPTTCPVGQFCSVKVVLDELENDDEGENIVASIAGTFVPGDLELNGLDIGSCAIGSALDQNGNKFALSGLGRLDDDGMKVPFCEGDVLYANVKCDAMGTFDLAIDNVTLGDVVGHNLDGACAASGVITCIDDQMCEDTVPRLEVMPRSCPAGESCDVSILFFDENDDPAVAASGELDLDPGLVLGSNGIRRGDCIDDTARKVEFETNVLQFATADLEKPKTSLCEGSDSELMIAEVICTDDVSDQEIRLVDVSLGRLTGTAFQTGCGRAGTIRCTPGACDGPPRLEVEATRCPIGAPCDVKVDLNDGGEANKVTEISGTLVVPAELTLGDSRQGTCAFDATLEQTEAMFTLSELDGGGDGDVMSFCDGDVLYSEVTCTADVNDLDSFPVDIGGVTFRNINDELVPGACAAGNMVTCIDTEACNSRPRLTVEPPSEHCTAGVPCSVSILLEDDPDEAAAASGTITLDGDVVIRGITEGSCISGRMDTDLLTNQAKFAVADLDKTKTSLCPGAASDLLTVEVLCNTPGESFDLAIDNVSLGDTSTNGTPFQTACDVPATIDCLEPSDPCTGPPELQVEDTDCPLGEFCDVKIKLADDNGQRNIVSVAGTFQPESGLMLGTAVRGSCALEAELEQANFKFALTELGKGDDTKDVFCDGDILYASVKCDPDLAPNTMLDLDLDGVTYGDLDGHSVPGACTASGTITCVDTSECTDALPRLIVDGASCQITPDSQSCTVDVPVLLDDDGNDVASIAGALVADEGLNVLGVKKGSCLSSDVPEPAFNDQTDKFALADVAIPGNDATEPFCKDADKEVLLVEVECDGEGMPALTIDNPSLGVVPDGTPLQTSCAIAGTVQCTTSTNALEATCGDANYDGDVTTSDALLIMRASVDAYAPCPFAVCDVDEDLAVTAQDGFDVLYATARGKTDELTCP